MELSSDAKSYLRWINSDTLIDPDDWHFNINVGGKRIHCTPQLKRELVRKPLVEINAYKPNLLSPILKKEFNLMRMVAGTDPNPSDEELVRLKNKLKQLSDDGQIKFWIKCLNDDPDYKLQNTIISAWMIDIQDVIDFINGVHIRIIYKHQQLY